jgi:hypothetical protein
MVGEEQTAEMRVGGVAKSCETDLKRIALRARARTLVAGVFVAQARVLPCTLEQLQNIPTIDFYLASRLVDALDSGFLLTMMKLAAF